MTTGTVRRGVISHGEGRVLDDQAAKEIFRLQFVATFLAEALTSQDPNVTTRDYFESLASYANRGAEMAWDAMMKRQGVAWWRTSS